MFPFKNTSFTKLFDRAPRSFSSVHTKSTDNTLKHSPQHTTHRSSHQKTKRIKTFVRFRPISVHQMKLTNACINLTFTKDQTVNINGNSYQFQKIFGQASSQAQVYRETTSHLIDNFFEGYDSTLMAYGQTGSGKTFTMFGDHRRGLVHLAGQQIFKRLNSQSKLFCSVLQIYNEAVSDLLNPHIKVKKLSPSILQVLSAEHLSQIIIQCHESKKNRATSLNDMSSRSHIIFTMRLQQKVGDQTIQSKFSLVDLAGNERIDKSNPSDLNETKNINLSLSCLTKTIKALVKKQQYIPFRESKLTQVLQDSLTGYLSMIITCSSHSSCLNETLNSLRFGVESKRLESVSTKNIVNNIQNTVQKVLFDSLKSEVENYEQKMNRIKQILNSASKSSVSNKFLEEIAIILQTSIRKQNKVFDAIKIPNFHFNQQSISTINLSEINSKNQEISKLQQEIQALKVQIQKYKELIKPLSREPKIEYLTFQKEVLMCQIQQLQKQFNLPDNNISQMRSKDQYIVELQRKIDAFVGVVKGTKPLVQEKRVLKVKKIGNFKC